MRVARSLCLGGLFHATSLVHALELDINNADSILSASKAIVERILGIYNQSDIPGLFPDPYYWYEAGLTFDSLVEYYTASGDQSILQIVQDGILFQTGDDNFMPVNQTKSLGNDDQAIWALTAMTAAELNLPPRADQNITWLQLAENVFNAQVARWDVDTCNGGLRWQIFTFNNGYNYKNSVSQGAFAYLAARLARFTGNSTYSDWAQRAAQWSMDVDLISDTYNVYDGTDSSTNCTQVNHIQWTIDTGLFLGAATYAFNATNSSFWSDMISPFVTNTLKVFTKDAHILFESACSGQSNCQDPRIYRTILARALADIRSMGNTGSNAADFANQILQNSARGAAAQCSGGDSGTVCGNDWTTSEWDGTQGLRQDLSALAVIMANLPAMQLNSVNSTNSETTVTNGTATLKQNGTTTENSPDSMQTGGGVSCAGAWSSAGTLGVVVLVASLVLFM